MKIAEFIRENKDIFLNNSVVVTDNVTTEVFNKKNLKKYDYPGIYIITDGNDEVIYIGSAYAGDRTIAVRLEQYFYKGSGNTFANALVRAGKAQDTDAALLLIKGEKYRFVGFEHKNLEYELIAKCDSIINKAGN